jgi:Uma2 family endonuclease
VSLQLKPFLTPQDYLALERQAETKSEYYAGEVFAMAGASRKHNTIVTNLAYLLVGQLKGRSCEVYNSDMRVKVSATGLYTYPDLVVVCGKPRFDDDQEDTLLNPTVIIEVLSKSTEAYDRSEKFAQYRALESMADYLLIAQDIARLEHYARQPDGSWRFLETVGLDSVAVVDSIQCRLSLADVYDKVDLAEPRRDPRLVVVKEQGEEYTPSPPEPQGLEIPG